MLKNNIPLDSKPHGVDVAIIGGGPAGAAAALTLLSYSSLSVAVVERSNYSAWRVGETLPPSVLPLLQYLGLSQSFAAQAHLPAYGTSAAWGGPEIIARDFLFTGRGQGWHLDRVHFDRKLAELVVERGGFLLTESVVTNEWREQGSWRLLVRGRNMPASTGLDARFVIDASGKGATFARRQGARRSVQDRLMGMVGIYELKAGSQRNTFTLVESCPMGWWYSALLPNSRMVIAFMSDIDTIRQYRMYQIPRWHELVQSSQHIKQRLVGGVLKSPPVLCPAFSQLLDTIAGDGWVATGEAAICFDPLSSMGIGYALVSGIQAARAVHNALTDSGRQMSHYTTDVKQHFLNHIDRKRQYYLIEQRWPNWPFWLRRHQKSRSDT